MVREPHLGANQTLLGLALLDGRASTDGIRRALGMFDGRFNFLGLTIGVSYGARDGR
jgi:hypothetical protein